MTSSAGTPSALGKVTAAAYAGLARVLFVLYPVLVRLHGFGVRQYFSGVWPAVRLAFVSRSAIDALSLTRRVTGRTLGVPSVDAAFAVPLGATTKMDGCASIYPAISAIFVARFFGIDLGSWLPIAVVYAPGVSGPVVPGTRGNRAPQVHVPQLRSPELHYVQTCT